MSSVKKSAKKEEKTEKKNNIKSKKEDMISETRDFEEDAETQSEAKTDTSAIKTEKVNDTIISKSEIEAKISKTSKKKTAQLLLSISIGLSQFSNLSLSYFFKDTLKATPSQISLVASLVLIPMICKPLFGLVTDMYPLFGYRRKVYIILCGLINSVIWVIMSFIEHSISLTTFLLFVNSSCLSFSGVLGEAIAVELNNSPSTGKNNRSNGKVLTKYFIFSYTGMFISAILRAIVARYVQVKKVFLIASLVPILIIISGFLYEEEKVKYSSSYRTLSTQPSSIDTTIQSSTSSNEQQEQKDDLTIFSYLNIVLSKEIMIPFLFLLILSSTPSYMESSFYYLIEKKGFTPESFGILTIVLALSLIITAIIFRKFFHDARIKVFVSVCLIIAFCFSSFFNVWMFFGFESKLLVYISISVYVAVKEMSTLPIMNLGCLICPQNYEGGVYSLFSSGRNLGRALGNLMSSIINIIFKVKKENFDYFNEMIFFQNILLFVPVVVLFFIPNEYFDKKKENKRQEIVEVKIEMKKEEDDDEESKN